MCLLEIEKNIKKIKKKKVKKLIVFLDYFSLTIFFNFFPGTK